MSNIPFGQLASRIGGELHTGNTLRRLYATDASEYQELPAGVVMPESEDDIREIIRFAGQNQLGLIPRAAGTSLAGQCVGNGLVVDVSKHFTRILSVDEQARRVRVQPGVVRDELNHFLAPRGMFFGPKTSTANRAMMGGMVGNNSCGSNSPVYGSTRDHLVSVRGFLSDGSEATFGELTRDEFEQKCAGPDTLETGIYQKLRALPGDSENRRAITGNFPRRSIPRRNTGYALDLLMDAEVFDPESEKPLNPGKIIDTPPMDTSLRHSPGHATPEYETVFDFSNVLGVVRAAEKCNGSGDCRKGPKAGGTMCPSYMATRAEKHTTRARANILRQILTSPADPRRPFDNSEIKEVMDLCLSCKACKSECPSSVDITKLKAEFLQHYHDAHGVPLRSRIVAHFADSARLASLAPWLYNAVLQTPFLRRISNRLLGFHPERSMPRLNRVRLRRWFGNRTPLAPLRGKQIGRVHLFCDEFTDFNDLDAGIATVELLELLGYEVRLPEHAESGRASLSKGLVRRAKRFANENVRQFSNVVSAAEPLIGIEPSCILGFRDEYPALVDPPLREAARQLAPHCLMLDEFITREIDAGRIDSDCFTDEARTVHLHGHCHQKALASVEPTLRMLSLPANYSAREIPSGCCGMAGSFGYEREHYEVSMQVGSLVLFPHLEKLDPGVLVAAPGTSCRHQIHDGTGRSALHPAEICRNALKTDQ